MTLDEALEASIAAWEKRAAGEFKEVTYGNCPLCQFVMDPASHKVICENCPVMHRTGNAYCIDTPALDYIAISDVMDDDELQIPQSDLMAKAALEVEFLKSLRRT